MARRLYREQLSDMEGNNSMQHLINVSSDSVNSTADNRCEQFSYNESVIECSEATINSLESHANTTQTELNESGSNVNVELVNVRDAAMAKLENTDNVKAKKRQASEGDGGECEIVNVAGSLAKKMCKDSVIKCSGNSTNEKSAQGKAVKKTKSSNQLVNKSGRKNQGGVKDILDHKIENGVSYYLVRWKDYKTHNDTWEAENTLNCPTIIKKFKKIMQKMTKLKKNSNSSRKSNGKGNSSNNSTTSKDYYDPNKEWEVEKIVDYGRGENGPVFRIRWKGYGPSHDTWEPEENLNCDYLKEKFMKGLNAQKSPHAKNGRNGPKQTNTTTTMKIPMNLSQNKST